MPLAIEIVADTVPPLSLTFFRYYCTTIHVPNKTGLLRFCKDSSVMCSAPGSPLLLLAPLPCIDTIFIDLIVVSLTFHFIFFENSPTFECFRQASSLEDKSEEHQVNTKVYKMGDKADNILHSQCLTDEEKKKYETVKKPFKNYFALQEDAKPFCFYNPE